MKKSFLSPVRYLKGIGPKKAKAFNKLGIYTIEDLLYYFPRRYEDRTNFASISKLKEGQAMTTKAQILAKAERMSWRKRGFSIIELAVGDNTGKIYCVWFNQPYLKEYFKVGETLILYGKVERYAKRLQMNSPEFEIVVEDNADSLNIGRIVPVYPLPEMITQRNLRRLIKHTLDEFLILTTDSIPYDIRSRNNLLNLAKALLNIHFPENRDMQKRSYERLSFEEFFLFQLPLVIRKLRRKEKQGIAHRIEGELVQNFISSIPFKLTKGQEKVLQEIKLDMAIPQTMQRLLQGDVGSGKTIVATIAGVIAIQGGYQVAFMVPTEVLAKQHYQNIVYRLSHTAYRGRKINTALLTGSLGKKEKERFYQEIKEGKIDLVIGTHALLEEYVEFKNLGLVVIDEQHKFGVGQRALLPKKGTNPDVLIMTATPIPRTLAITLYGDLDISVINELPPGRLPIKTLHFTKGQIQNTYGIIKEQLRLAHQVFIVYPVIEESYALDIEGAKKMYEELGKSEFKDFKLGLIHGRLKEEEQDEIMQKFKDRDLDILVATTVLEVGIDIPNATCMLIAHAERFGLAQLHQLRGRVGRGGFESYCILVSDSQTEEARMRIEAMVKYSDGFRIAQEDLKIRGPGEFFGRRQSGLAELKIGNPLTQMKLLKHAREEALNLLNLDPKLEERPHLLLKERLLQRFPEYEKLILVG
ncbi:MAG: ATP-dependent DNA helicase RecG [Candidatus Omnitrophota bacterium]